MLHRAVAVDDVTKETYYYGHQSISQDAAVSTRVAHTFVHLPLTFTSFSIPYQHWPWPTHMQQMKAMVQKKFFCNRRTRPISLPYPETRSLMSEHANLQQALRQAVSSHKHLENISDCENTQQNTAPATQRQQHVPQNRQACEDPPRITAMTLPAHCSAPIPAADTTTIPNSGLPLFGRIQISAKSQQAHKC